MNTPQNVTKAKNANGEKPMDMRHQAFIDYRALNGLISDDDGIRKMTVDDFATKVGVDRRQLYRWQESIPDFWDKVNARRHEIAPRARLQKMHEVWYLSALKPGADGYRDRQLWLANFDDDFRMPTEKLEHSAGTGLADMIAHKRRGDDNDRKIIDADISQSNT